MYLATLAAALFAYLVAAAASFTAFAHPGSRRTAAVARGLTALGFLVHAVAIGAGCAALGGRHLLTGTGAAGLGAWIAAAALVELQRRLRSSAASVAVLPAVIAVAFPGLFVTAPAAGAGRGLAAVPAVRLHVAAAMAGVALLVLAAVVGALYLVQHRQLKQKRFGPMLRRLPALGTLDRANRVLVLAAGAAFTVALASGGLAARIAWCATWTWDAQRVGAAGAWLVLAALAVAAAAGVRGTRQAVVTVAGLVVVLACLAGGRQGGAEDPHARIATATAVACAQGR